MKARVKATGEIVEIFGISFDASNGMIYDEADLIIPKDEPDYWDKLHHQYAGMAMQGILSNNDLLAALCNGNKEVSISKMVSDNADIIATTLINKLKEDSQCEK